MIRKPMIDIEQMEHEGVDPRYKAKRPIEMQEQELESERKRNGIARRSIRKSIS